MPANAIQTIERDGDLIVEINTDIPLSGDGGPGIARCNVYRPADTEEGKKYPVILTMGPYGKDIPYSDFHPKSFSEIPAEQKSKWSGWETPEPTFWTKHGYVVVRVDERGLGQSPGFLDTMSSSTAGDFVCCVEWCAEQSWSTGKVGLLGVSYFGGSQWRVAARQPKGLACIIPWEGMSDYYRDRCRQGGIYSNGFIKFWWNRQIVSNQYGLAGRAARKWGPDTIEGDIDAETLIKNRNDQCIDNANNRFTDDPYYASREYDKGQIQVPLLSVANWGGILLHLRGNVIGYSEAGSKNKWLYFIAGRHDLPFYLPEYVALQKSFLDAWLHGKDDKGWLEGPNVKVPAVNVLVRKGNPGYNTVEADRSFKTRDENEWPIKRTVYTKCHLHSDLSMAVDKKSEKETKLEYKALDGEPITFTTEPFSKEVEVTGHITANITMGVSASDSGKAPVDLDVMVTLRHYEPSGNEVFYTGTAGDKVPLCKGFLRASLRKIDTSDPRHHDYLPFRRYSSEDEELLKSDTPYELIVEVWPTSVVVEKGGRLAFEIAPKDTQGADLFTHNAPSDRSPERFGGVNQIYFGEKYNNFVTLPVIPPVESAQQTTQATQQSQTDKPFQVCIVGAGLAGLATAIALRGPGREITVLEQSRMKSEVGAAIHLAPNATKICAKWGLDIQKAANATICRELQVIAKDGTVIQKQPIDSVKFTGAPWLFQHRVDLHNAFKEAATSTERQGEPARIVGSAKVTKIDAAAGVVYTERGDEYHADLIVGSDGIHSVARDTVLGSRKVATPSGHSAYRCLIPKEKIADIPEAAEVCSAEHSILRIITGRDRRVITYPCRGGTILNVVAVCPDAFMNEGSTESWNAHGSKSDLIKTFEGFPDWLIETLKRSESPGLWQLRVQEPLETWVKDRLIIIGDASHAMLPHQGQGAGQSVEDAEALGAFFEDVHGRLPKEDVKARLQKVFDARIERATTVQEYSRASSGVDQSASGQVQLDPQKFTMYNWQYNGCMDWIAKRNQKPAVAAH